MPSAECRRLALQSSIHALTRTQDRGVPIVHRPGKHELDARAATGTIGCDEAGRLPRRAFAPCMCSDQFPAVVGDGAARRASQGRAALTPGQWRHRRRLDIGITKDYSAAC
jgi:hypothetical protein